MANVWELNKLHLCYNPALRWLLCCRIAMTIIFGLSTTTFIWFVYYSWQFTDKIRKYIHVELKLVCALLSNSGTTFAEEVIIGRPGKCFWVTTFIGLDSLECSFPECLFEKGAHQQGHFLFLLPGKIGLKSTKDGTFPNKFLINVGKDGLLHATKATYSLMSWNPICGNQSARIRFVIILLNLMVI